MEPRPLNRFCRLFVKPYGVRVVLAHDISRDGAFQLVLAELLEGGGPNYRVVERGGP